MAANKLVLLLCAFMMIVGCSQMALALAPGGGIDPKGDMDRDGLTNANEYLYGTDPNDPDSDADGCYDGWEVWYEVHRAVVKGTETQIISKDYHFDPNSAADAGTVADTHSLIQVRDRDANRMTNDPDDDGWNNLHEFLGGTDPTNPNTDDDSYKVDSTDPDPLVSNGVTENPTHNNDGGNGGGGSGLAELMA